MNFTSIKNVTAHCLAFVLLLSTVLSPVVLATSVIEEEPQEIQEEYKGTGGSNPLVVARLRAAGLEMRKKMAEQEALQSLKTEEVKSVKASDSRYNTQILPPYIPDFKTIGDVQAELEAELQNELTVVVDQEKILEKTADLAGVIASSHFKTQFSDIEDSENKESIVVLDGLNIISGRENTKFKPTEGITRKEAIKISTLISGNEISVRKLSSVSDIDNLDWSVPYVESMIDTGVINLDSEKKLEGDLVLTADEALALYLLNAGVCIDVDEEAFPFYSKFKMNYSSAVSIADYETDLSEGEEMTREAFAELSVQVLNALSVTAEYVPSIQLLGEQYSASQRGNEVDAVRELLLDILLK